MEILVTVDNDDNVIGSADKKEIYEKNLTHRISHVIIFNNKGEMALQLRSKKVSFCPSHWCTSAAGHVRDGESYEEAALREYEEELGANSELKSAGKYFYHVNGIPDRFLALFESDFNGPFTIDERAVEKVEFFPMEKIEEMIKNGEKFHPEFIFLLKNHYGVI